MNEFVPRGYLILKKALEYFGQLKHGDEWEAEKASSEQEFQHLLFEETVSAKLFVAGRFLSFESSIWGGEEAEHIFAWGWPTIRGGNEYFPAEVHGRVHGRVLVEQASIDALFDGDADDPSQSPEALSDGALTDEPSPAPDSKGGTTAPPPRKRGAGLKRGPYYGKLKKHLKWRKDNRNDLDTALLKELREDARRRLAKDGVKGIPKSRSGLEDAIKAALRDFGVNR